MIELLKLCGFEQEEIESELSRIEKAFNKLGITTEDIERGKQRLTRYYAMELKGMRKILRLLIKEVVNAVLAREEGKTKIVYEVMASGFDIFSTALASKSKEVYAVVLEFLFQFVLGCIFNKIVPILEAAEERWLKAGAVAHCGNPKTIVGLLALGLVPMPDLLVSTGFLCDTAPKTADLLHELYDIPTCCYDTCQDREIGEYPLATKRIADFTAKSLRRFTKRLQEVVGFEITDNLLQEVINAKAAFTSAVVKLQDLIERSDPLVISPNDAAAWGLLSFLPLSIDRMPEAIDAINTLYEELQDRVDRGVGVVEKGAPRILALLPSHFTEPRAELLPGELGIAVAYVERAPATDVGIPKDPYDIMSWRTLGGFSLTSSLSRRLPSIIEQCKRSNVDGVLDRYDVHCRSTCGDALIIKDEITKELGIPVLLQERDAYDPRQYNHEQYKRVLEVFKTMLVKQG